MSVYSLPSARRHDDITIPAIRVAFVLSLLIHGAALWTWLPRMRLLTPIDAEQHDTGTPLDVKLVAPESPPAVMPSMPPSEPLVAQRSPLHSAPPPKPSVQPPSAPPVIAIPRSSPEVPRVTPADTAPAPLTPTGATDLSSYIEARRRARGESTTAESGNPSDVPSTDDENERMNRIIAANIGANAKPAFGTDPRIGGGLFQMKSLDFSEAEFYFFGWDKDINRNAKQLIEVRRGDNPDIRIAVVRRMIAIIREREKGDFLFESRPTGRQVQLSARLKDNAELESFLMQEFFSDPHRR